VELTATVELNFGDIDETVSDIL